MKRLSIAAVALFLVLGLTVQPVAAEISLGIDALGRAQWLESEDATGTDNDEEFAFNSLRANMHVYGDVAQGMEVYVETFINPSPNAIQGTPGDFVFNQGYLTFTNLHPSIDVKAGEFEVDFGQTRLDRTDNGQSMDNPLVGNYLVDPVGVQPGVQLTGQHDRLAWSFSVTNGSGDLQGGNQGNSLEESLPGDQFTQDAELAWTGKVWGNITPDLSAALSFYQSDQSDAIENTGAPIGSLNARGGPLAGGASNVFGSQAQSGIYQGLSNNASPTLGAFGNGGADVTAWQIDGEYELPGFGTTFEGHWGQFEDDAVSELAGAGLTTTTGGLAGPNSGDQEWDYWGLQGKHPLTPQAYVVGRWSSTEGDVDGFGSDAEYDKYQLGAGYQYNENTLAKIEWVSQEQDQTLGGGSGPEFDGLTTEVAVSF